MDLSYFDTLKLKGRGKYVSEQKQPEYEDEADEIVALYSSYKENNYVFAITFETVDKDGNYTLPMPGTEYRFVMKATDTPKGDEFNLEKRADWLSRQIDSQIKEIDQENKIIYMRSVQRTGTTMHQRNTLLLSDTIMGLYKASRKTGTPFREHVRGRVLLIRRDSNGAQYAHVALYGLSVFGRVYISTWSKAYTHDLNDVVDMGAEYDFDVVGCYPFRNEKECYWILEHSPYTEDPWEIVAKNRVGFGSVIQVRCTKVDEALGQWNGVTSNDRLIPSAIIVTGHIKKLSGKEIRATQEQLVLTQEQELSGEDAMEAVENGVENVEKVSNAVLTKDPVTGKGEALLPEEGKEYLCTVVKCEMKKFIAVKAYRPATGGLRPGFTMMTDKDYQKQTGYRLTKTKKKTENNTEISE